MSFLKGLPILLSPLIFAAFAPIFLYAENPDEGITFSEFIVPFAVVIVCTAFLVLISSLIIRDGIKASAIVSIFVLVFFAYGPIYDYLLLHEVSIGGFRVSRHIYLLSAAGAICLASVPLVLLYRGSLAPLLQIAAIGVAILVVFNIGQIAVNGIGQSDDGVENVRPFPSASGAGSIGVELPDIYYIILDGYGRADVLKEVHNYDNSEFINSLTQKGFFVASQSRSNYVDTVLSVSSSLNMRYLKESEKIWLLFENNAVQHYVQNLGYQYVHFESDFGLGKRNRHADVEFLGENPFHLLLNDYSEALVRSTPIYIVAGRFSINLSAPFSANRAERFKRNLQNLRKIPGIPGPTFTFNHNLVPHPPHIFDRDGNTPPVPDYNSTGNIWLPTEPYIDQLFYVSKAIEQAVDEILASSPAEPIIIIQADHGPGSQLPSDGIDAIYDYASDLAIFERTGILNAYYLPEYCRSGLYPEISPVNSFRAVFNSCLGADFELLADEIIWPGKTEGGPLTFFQIGQ